MNRRDILHRLAGVALVLGAGASTLLHREVWLAHASGPATGLEAVLGLLTFALASLGILLVIGGARLRDGWKRDCDRAARRREQRVKPDQGTVDAEAEHRRIMAAAVDSMAFAGGRAAIATFLVMRARQAALDARLVRKTTTEKYEPGAQ
jgi:hypothetical protein